MVFFPLFYFDMLYVQTVGIILGIFDTFHRLIYTYFYLNDPIVRQVFPKIHRNFEDANTEFSEKPNRSMVSFLGGYLTCCTSLDRSHVIIGNISGYLLLVRLLEGKYCFSVMWYAIRMTPQFYRVNLWHLDNLYFQMIISMDFDDYE